MSIKKLYMSKPEGRRSVGRPKMRWLDVMEEDEAQKLLGCTALFLIECRQTFQRYVGRYSVKNTAYL
jgi:hypothetical protein